MKFVLIAMNVCVLYKICNFEIFSTVNSSMASKMAAKMKILFIGDILQFFLKNHHFLLFVVFDITYDVSCQRTVNNRGRTGYIHSTKTKQ